MLFRFRPFKRTYWQLLAQKTKNPQRSRADGLGVMVARGGIEAPTQGFSTLSNRRKTIGFQTVVLLNKDVAQTLCL